MIEWILTILGYVVGLLLFTPVFVLVLMSINHIILKGKRNWNSIIGWVIFISLLLSGSNFDNAFIISFGYYVVTLLSKVAKDKDRNYQNLEDYFMLVSIVILIYSFVFLNYEIDKREFIKNIQKVCYSILRTPIKNESLNSIDIKSILSKQLSVTELCEIIDTNMYLLKERD